MMNGQLLYQGLLEDRQPVRVAELLGGNWSQPCFEGDWDGLQKVMEDGFVKRSCIDGFEERM